MSRTLPLTFLYFLPIGIFGVSFKQLYLWAQFPDAMSAAKQHLITNEQAHAIFYKKSMLNPTSFWVASIFCFLVWFLYEHLLNKWSLQRDADPNPNVPYWQTKFENLSGLGVVVYAVLLTVVAILWVMSLDPHVVLHCLRPPIPGRPGIRRPRSHRSDPGRPLEGRAHERPSSGVTEQHDLGKLCFAFTMLNIYLAFSAFLIIWVGELAGRDSLVPGPHPRQLGRDRPRSISSSTGSSPSRCCFPAISSASSRAWFSSAKL